MLASALPFSSMLACVHTTARRPLVAISLWLSVFGVSSPGLALALPSQTDEAALLKARAEALGAEGRDAESAATYERFADKTTDDTQRLVGYLHATIAWRAAYASSGKTREHCSAKAVLQRAVADETIAARGRDEFRTLLEKLEAKGINCQPTVALLDPLGDSPVRSDTPAACRDATACDAAPACDVPTCDTAPACDNAPPACDAPACDAPACDAPTCDAAPTCDNAPTCDAPTCDDISSADAKQTPVLLPLESGLLADNTESASRKTVALRTSGGITLGLGLVALGVMTPFAHRDRAIGEELLGLAQLKDQSGGRLSAADAERVAALHAEGQKTLRRSLALGIVGGASTVAGFALLLASRRVRSSKMVSLQPQIDLSQGSCSFSFSLEGRF